MISAASLLSAFVCLGALGAILTASHRKEIASLSFVVVFAGLTAWSIQETVVNVYFGGVIFVCNAFLVARRLNSFSIPALFEWALVLSIPAVCSFLSWVFQTERFVWFLLLGSFKFQMTLFVYEARLRHFSIGKTSFFVYLFAISLCFWVIFPQIYSHEFFLRLFTPIICGGQILISKFAQQFESANPLIV